MSQTIVKPAGMLSNRYKIDQMPDLTGKVAVVVGGSRGIGEACVHALVQKHCKSEPDLPLLNCSTDLQSTSSPLLKNTPKPLLTMLPSTPPKPDPSSPRIRSISVISPPLKL